jgi:hypothetical protein
MMEEDRNDNPGKLIARTQPRSTTKWSKYIGPYRILKFIVDLPSPRVKCPSILVVFIIKVHSSE